MRDHEREDIARPVDENCAVTFNREGLIAVEPSARCGCVTTRRIVQVCAARFDGGHACRNSGSRSVIVGAHGYCGAQAMAEAELGGVGKDSVNLGGGISAMRQQEIKNAFASFQRIHIGFIGQTCVRPHSCICFIDQRGGKAPRVIKWPNTTARPDWRFSFHGLAALISSRLSRLI